MNIDLIPNALPCSSGYIAAEKAINQHFADYCTKVRRIYMFVILTEVSLLGWWSMLLLSSLALVPCAIVLLCSIVYHLKLFSFLRIDENVVQSIGVSRMIAYRQSALDGALSLPPIRKFTLLSQYPPITSWQLFSLVGISVFAFATFLAALLTILTASSKQWPFATALLVHRFFVCWLHYRLVQTFYERAVIDSARKVIRSPKDALKYARERAAMKNNAMLDQLRNYYNGYETAFLRPNSATVQHRAKERASMKQQQTVANANICMQTASVGTSTTIIKSTRTV